jgi:hypothetical protein
MSARKKDKSPAELIAELEAQKMRLAVEKAEAQQALGTACDLLGVTESGPNTRGSVRMPADGSPTIEERRQRAEEGRALGRDHEPLDLITADEAELGRTITVNRRRIVSLGGAMATLTADVEAVEDTHIEWFARKAHESSLAEVEKRPAARAAMMEVFEARQAAQARWSKIDMSRRRLGWELLGGVPADDLAGMISGFDASGRFAPWPKGKRPDERELAAAWSPADGYVSRSGGREDVPREPLIEMI